MSIRQKSLGRAIAILLLSIAAISTACNRQVAESASASKTVHVVTSANFQSEVLSSSQPVLVDFWATWCGPCKLIAPIVSELATEFEGKVKVVKVDVDAESDLAQQYGISAIPTLLIFKDGKQVDQIVGLASKEVLKAKLGKFVGNINQRASPPKP